MSRLQNGAPAVPLISAPVVQNRLPDSSDMKRAGSFKKHDETVVSTTHSVSTAFVFASGESFARAPTEPDRRLFQGQDSSHS